MAEPSISICVPTYNRSGYLRECLTHLIAECAPESIPICVSDNASTDDTPAVVAAAQQQYSRVIYQRQSTNIGPAANFVAVMAMAQTPYAWLCSDDDYLLPGAVRRMSVRVCLGVVDLLLPNRELRGPNLEQLTGQPIDCTPFDRRYDASPALLIEHGIRRASCITGLVVRCAAWQASVRREYIALPHFAHLAIVADMMASGARAVVMTDVLIWTRIRTFSWINEAVPVWFQYLPRALLAVPGYTLEARRRTLWADWWPLHAYAVSVAGGHRGEAVRCILSSETRDIYRRLGAWGMYAWSVLLVLGGCALPAVAWRGIRRGVRARETLRYRHARIECSDGIGGIHATDA